MNPPDWLRSIVGPPSEPEDESTDTSSASEELQKAQRKIEDLRKDMANVQARLRIIENDYRASGVLPPRTPRRPQR